MKVFWVFISLLLVYSCKKNQTNKDFVDTSFMEIVVSPKDSSDVNIISGDEIIKNKEARYLNYSGVEFAKRGEYRKAEKQFIAAYRHDPKNPIILNNMGNIYKIVGTNKMALEYYNESFAASDSTYFNAGYNLGNTYCDIGEYDKSLKILDKIIHDSDNIDNILLSEYVKVRVYLSQKDCDKAIQIYTKIKTDLDKFTELKKNIEKTENLIQEFCYE